MDGRNLRKRVEDLIEKDIETGGRSTDARVAGCGCCGRRGFPSDLLKGRHLRSRVFLQQIERANIGLYPKPSMQIREGKPSRCDPQRRTNALQHS